MILTKLSDYEPSSKFVRNTAARVTIYRLWIAVCERWPSEFRIIRKTFDGFAHASLYQKSRKEAVDSLAPWEL